MDGFPRLQLFTPREIRAASVFAAAALALLAAGLVYARPVARPAPAAAPVSAPRDTVAAIAAPTADIAYASRLDYAHRIRELYRTDDGGRTWHHLALPVAMLAFSVSVQPGDAADVMLFSFASAGFSGVPPPPRYWLSHDRGAHWSAVDAPSAAGAPRGFQVGDFQHWYMTTSDVDGFRVHESSDQGRTWHVLVTVPGPQPQIDGVSLDARGVGVGQSGGVLWLEVTEPRTAGASAAVRLFSTADGGRTWTRASLPSLPGDAPGAAGYSMPQIAAGGRGYLAIFPTQGPVPVGGFSTSIIPYLSTTYDGGRTWSPPRTLQHYPFFSVVGSLDWWAASGTTLYRSSDLGLTWSETKAAVPAGERLQQIFRATPKVAWNVFANIEGGLVTGEPDRTRLLRTTDGGRHWSEVAFPGL